MHFPITILEEPFDVEYSYRVVAEAGEGIPLEYEITDIRLVGSDNSERLMSGWLEDLVHDLLIDSTEVYDEIVADHG